MKVSKLWQNVSFEMVKQSLKLIIKDIQYTYVSQIIAVAQSL